MKKRDFKGTTLIISDMHIPYNHPDMVAFLAKVKSVHKPKNVICVGDEIDAHAMSFHDSDPDLPSAGDELKLAIDKLKPVYKLFPKVDVLSSNHGDMVYRKGKHCGIPRKYLRDYGDILDAPSGWEWHNEFKFTSGDVDIIVRHQFSKAILKSAQFESCSLIAGHFHEDFSISYASNHDKLLFGMTVGCLIDKKALAFEYNKTNMKRPILGVGIVRDGKPQLIPMILDKDGNWIGKL